MNTDLYVAIKDLCWQTEDAVREAALALPVSQPFTSVQLHVLVSLYREDGQHPSNLARSVGRSPVSFTTILDRLVERGLIERREDPSDRRAVFIHLTPAAEVLRVAVLDVIAQVNTVLLERVHDWYAEVHVAGIMQGRLTNEWKQFIPVGDDGGEIQLPFTEANAAQIAAEFAVNLLDRALGGYPLWTEGGTAQTPVEIEVEADDPALAADALEAAAQGIREGIRASVKPLPKRDGS